MSLLIDRDDNGITFLTKATFDKKGEWEKPYSPFY
jgi:hypothetical protein